MRKLALVFLASVALVGSACGGGGDKKDNASADVDAGAKVNSEAAGAAAAAAASKVCGGKEAVAFAATTAAAMSQTNGGKDFQGMADALRKAGDAAPSEIKADFTLIVTTEASYLELVASANGNYMQLAQNPKFQELAQKMSAEDFKTAAEHVDSYFAKHCKS
jgi:hypothetical protein